VEEYALTLGGLVNTCSTLHNRTCKCSLNYQKSAEAIVPNISRMSGKGWIN